MGKRRERIEKKLTSWGVWIRHLATRLSRRVTDKRDAPYLTEWQKHSIVRISSLLNRLIERRELNVDDAETLEEIYREIGWLASWSSSAGSRQTYRNMMEVVQDVMKSGAHRASAARDSLREFQKKFRQVPDERRAKLFRLATRLYYNQVNATGLKRPISFQKALKDANRAEQIYPHAEFDKDFPTIEQHYRNWRTRHPDVLRQISEESDTDVTEKDTP